MGDKKCLICKDEKKISDFYMSYHPLHENGKVPACKSCIKKMVDIDDVESLYNMLKMIDKPFINHLWKSAKTKNSVIGEYFKLINAKDYRTFTWEDSVFDEEKDDTNKSQIIDNITQSPKKNKLFTTEEVIEKWGSGYTPEQYHRLENFHKDMMDSYEIETASHKDYLKKICIVSLKMEEALTNGKIDHFKKLSDAYDKLMHSAKFTAVQRSAADKTGGLNTFSEFFEFAEKQGFIPKFHFDEPQDIVDETIMNLQKFTKQLLLSDSNISSFIEESIKKIQNKEIDIDDDIDEDEPLNADDLDDDLNEPYLEIEEGDLD